LELYPSIYWNEGQYFYTIRDLLLPMVPFQWMSYSQGSVAINVSICPAMLVSDQRNDLSWALMSEYWKGKQARKG
jgi:hypothetical protein